MKVKQTPNKQNPSTNKGIQEIIKNCLVYPLSTKESKVNGFPEKNTADEREIQQSRFHDISIYFTIWQNSSSKKYFPNLELPY